ncbi:hypothetical protein FD755_016743 [Muntiacus reevesi]|uniref:Nucleophosmin n=1 Tax=Muntiacus reevesi TaxID=9886 RepID=A0A5N3XFC5_MUNRE|nr:hypothetical protein FD755_016743 [Muntiacus reevesi]
MEDSMDMDMSPSRPQNYLFGCELKADRDYPFKVDNDENKHQFSLRMVSLGAGAKDESHIVEAEAMDYEDGPIKVTLATLKMSVQSTVSLGGFEITPPMVLRLKCGSGPVHIRGQHLVVVEKDARSAPGRGSKFPQKKVKLAAAAEDDDYDDEEDDNNFDEEVEENAPVKKSVRDTPAKMHKNQTRMKKTQNCQHQDQKVKNPSKNRKKHLKHQKNLAVNLLSVCKLLTILKSPFLLIIFSHFCCFLFILKYAYFEQISPTFL